jgi:large subunit ribosomal protein L24
MQQPIAVDGDLEIGAVDLPAAIAVAIGAPAQSVASVGTGTGNGGGASGPWPSEPFDQGMVRLKGQIAVKAARVALTPKLAARDVRSVLQFGDAEVALQAIEGSIAGGRLGGELTFLRRAEGLTARGRVRVADANAAELLPGDGLVSGRLALDVSAEGTGMSAVALIGSLEGSGTFTLENGRVVRLDPAAFDTVIRAVDQGLPIDAARVRDRMDAALARGVLAVAQAEGAITINAGQARLSNTTVRAQRADLAVTGSVNLAESALDARLTMFGTGGAGAPANTRPEVAVALKGPVETPKRTIDVAALASWLALRAVELQSKKLDVLEGRAAVPSPTPAAVNVNTQPAPGPKEPAAAAARIEPDAAAPHPSARTQPTAPSVQKPKPTAPAAERAPPLPPAIDIRSAPAPAPRAQPGAAAGQGAPTQPQKPAAATVPPRPRSLSEILFGN